jgi:hypothetical protein
MHRETFCNNGFVYISSKMPFFRALFVLIEYTEIVKLCSVVTDKKTSKRCRKCPYSLEFLYKQILRTEVTNLLTYVGFEVLTEVFMKNFVFWDIMTLNPLKVNQHFGRTCLFHRQGPRIIHARNNREAGSKQSLIQGTCFLSKSRFISSRLHAVIFQNTKLLIVYLWFQSCRFDQWCILYRLGAA